MEEALSQKLFLLARNTWGKRRDLLNFEDAVYGVLHSISVIQLASAMFPRQFRNKHESIQWAMLSDLISSRYPAISAHGEAIRSLIPSDDIRKFNVAAVKLFNEAYDYDPYVLGTLFVKLKEAFRVTDGVAIDNKIVGKELLLRTQFFTEPYMVRFLIRKAFEGISDSKKLTVATFPTVIDPAAGACNFLIGALQEGVKSLPKKSKGTDVYSSAISTFVESLVGYEIDPLLAELGALNLDLAVANLQKSISVQRPKIFSGQPGEELGFLSIENCTDFFAALPTNKPKMILTNPPYLGRRMMGVKLKEYIKLLWPESKGDLCTAFTLRCADIMGAGDVLGIVHQNALFHLSSLVDARTRLLSHCSMIDTTNLGSGAFESLNGEKASVSLTVFQCEAQSKNSTVSNLSKLSYAKKVEALNNGNFEKKYISTQVNKFLGPQDSFSFHQTGLLQNLRGSLETYGKFASPMQGTSTGDNQRAIRFSWEIPAEDSDWVSASKGGGYARWWGLNRYLVLWGRAGERLKEIPGSALRNPSKQASTQLVFSDTGTNGLNVRCLKQGQVFIASGPGIYVKDGSMYAHLAFLNSRLATYFLRSLNPKLSVSPGYLKQLPFSKSISNNVYLSNAGKKCVKIKKEILSTKLGSEDYVSHRVLSNTLVDVEGYITKSISRDMHLESDKLALEAAIEMKIHSILGLSISDSKEIQADVGSCAAETINSNDDLDIVSLDLLLSRLTSTSLHYKNGVKLPGGIAADGPLEAAALIIGRSPSDIVKAVDCQSDVFQTLRRIYFNDLLHKSVLDRMSFTSDRTWLDNSVRINKICSDIKERIPNIETILGTYSPDVPKLELWIKDKLPMLHSDVFWGRPVLQVSESLITLKRTV